MKQIYKLICTYLLSLLFIFKVIRLYYVSDDSINMHVKFPVDVAKAIKPFVTFLVPPCASVFYCTRPIFPFVVINIGRRKFLARVI